jgi:hypothetical protein
MEDRYSCYNESLARLKKEYSEYKSLFIAFDFDNTVFDYHQSGDSYPIVENLLAECKQLGFKLILFTANEDEKLEKAVQYCTKHGYAPDYINESPIMETRKPFYNLLLDDRAGLGEAIKLLSELIQSIKEQEL